MINVDSVQQGLSQVKPPLRAKICICRDGVTSWEFVALFHVNILKPKKKTWPEFRFHYWSNVIDVSPCSNYTRGKRSDVITQPRPNAQGRDK